MKTHRLPVDGQAAVQGVFQHGALLVGDALIYIAGRDAQRMPAPSTFLVPDEGDADPVNMEMVNPIVCGVTSTGRICIAYRSGNRKPNSTEWDGTSSLYIGVGAASNLRPSSQAVVVQTTQPGPQGPKGDKGDTGAVGPSGAPGAPGGDAEVDDTTVDKIAARVWTLPPGQYANISGVDLGTMAQEFIAYLLTQRQDLWQGSIQRIDEAVLNLSAAGYQPKGN